MLAVVEDDEGAAAGERVEGALSWRGRCRRGRRVAETDAATRRRRDRCPHLARRRGGEFDDDGGIAPGPRRLEGERRLAGAARPDERHEAFRAELCADRREFALPADERCESGGDRRRCRRCRGRARGTRDVIRRPAEPLGVGPILEEIADDPVELGPRAPGVARPERESLAGERPRLERFGGRSSGRHEVLELRDVDVVA
ncbi:hypothetical protein G5T42_06810 [Microbacterium sp. 4R-513]|nr:hypothetical protein [Microbacterium sp. 4R-513]QIG39233.1 hypothetical protein G5T42_06810 [Microbacterium sp. 4R-513]